MSIKSEGAVTLRAWADGDLELLVRLLSDPQVTAHLGGPEPLERIQQRHADYCQPFTDPQFAILAGVEQAAVGWVGCWEREWQGADVYEAGWLLLPEAQGRGIGTRAVRQLVEHMRADLRGERYCLHAFPEAVNAASNAICRKVGFALQGVVDFEYPRGHWMRCNDWRLDLNTEG